jgi:HEAT repeat protein
VGDASTNGQGQLELEDLGEPTPPASTSPRMLVPLFLVPLVIVAVIVGLFLGLGSLIGHEKSLDQWVQQVESGGVNERWQAAAQLADLARSHPEQLEDPRIRARLREVFALAGPTEPRIRQYLAKLWSAIGDAEALPLIVEGIDRTTERIGHPEELRPGELEAIQVELTLYVSALGVIGNEEAAKTLLKLAADADAKVRLTVAEALGTLGRKSTKAGQQAAPEVIEALRKLHGDSDPWARMNAALALGKLDRADGMATLEAMLDREWLRRQGLQFPNDGSYSINEHDPAAKPILSALVTIESLLKGPEAAKVDRATLRAALEKAQRDPNSAVSERAGTLLKNLGA